jgi:hypothetical protein
VVEKEREKAMAKVMRHAWAAESALGPVERVPAASN